MPSFEYTHQRLPSAFYGWLNVQLLTAPRKAVAQAPDGGQDNLNTDGVLGHTNVIVSRLTRLSHEHITLPHPSLDTHTFHATSKSHSLEPLLHLTFHTLEPIMK